MDFSCYVTLFNYTANTFAVTFGPNATGTFVPAASSDLVPYSGTTPGQVVFRLTSGTVGGTAGSVTLSQGILNVQVAFGCPEWVDDNNYINIVTYNGIQISYYAATTEIQWLTTGQNWPPIDTVPTSGHPLYILLVVTN